MVYYDEIAANWYQESKSLTPLLYNLQELAYRAEPLWSTNWVWITTLIVGLARVVQGIYNNRPVSYLVIEIAIFVVLCLVVRQFYSRRVIIYKWAEEVLEQQSFNGPLHQDSIVNHFAVRGNSALDLFPAGLILAGFFTTYNVMDHSSILWPRERRDYGSGTGCGSGGGCGSSGGGGGSCGGGGGGCGGCGGGGD